MKGDSSGYMLEFLVVSYVPDVDERPLNQAEGAG